MKDEFNLETKDEIKRNIDHGVIRLATELKEDIDNKFYKANEKLLNQTVLINTLKERIDKAIEYIDMIQERRKDLSVEEYHNKWCKLFDYYESEAIMLDLLDILKGSDSNE